MITKSHSFHNMKKNKESSISTDNKKFILLDPKIFHQVTGIGLDNHIVLPHKSLQFQNKKDEKTKHFQQKQTFSLIKLNPNLLTQSLELWIHSIIIYQRQVEQLLSKKKRTDGLILCLRKKIVLFDCLMDILQQIRKTSSKKHLRQQKTQGINIQIIDTNRHQVLLQRLEESSMEFIRKGTICKHYNLASKDKKQKVCRIQIIISNFMAMEKFNSQLHQG